MGARQGPSRRSGSRSLLEALQQAAGPTVSSCFSIRSVVSLSSALGFLSFALPFTIQRTRMSMADAANSITSQQQQQQQQTRRNCRPHPSCHPWQQRRRHNEQQQQRRSLARRPAPAEPDGATTSRLRRPLPSAAVVHTTLAARVMRRAIHQVSAHSMDRTHTQHPRCR